MLVVLARVGLRSAHLGTEYRLVRYICFDELRCLPLRAGKGRSGLDRSPPGVGHRE